MTVAEYLAHQLDASGKSRNDIAREAGFERPNVLSMMRTGAMKIPLTAAPGLARALGIDPAAFLRRCMAEYVPELLAAMVSQGTGPISRNEAQILSVIRAATKNADPALRTKEQERELAQAVRRIFTS